MKLKKPGSKCGEFRFLDVRAAEGVYAHSDTQRVPKIKQVAALIEKALKPYSMSLAAMILDEIQKGEQ